MDYLFALHIGPVQGFIVSARRSRDLWFGSWLLSELAKAAAKRIEEHAQTTLIFPAPESDLKPGSSLSVANRVVAVVKGALGDLPGQVESAVLERLMGLAGETFDLIEHNGGANTRYDRVRAEKQVRDLPELFWVAYPIVEQENGYQNARSYVEAMMAARKATREFMQPTWGAEAIPKSSLDGQRESVISKDAYASRDASEREKQDKAKRLYRYFRARPAEQLSGVDLLKRLGNPSGSSGFPSTSHVASLSLLARMKASDQDVKVALAKYKKKLEDLDIEIDLMSTSHPILDRCDGSILYESRLLEEMVLRKEDRDAASKALDEFLQETVKERPSPYYTLLVGDGDYMGSVIDAQKTEEQHRLFSQTLSTFAASAKTTIARFDGVLVYAGGDDVLAFLPLHTALECAKQLSDDFRTRLQGFHNAQGQPPSFSAGLVIAHHLEPLSDVMRLARTAEQKAKQVNGKDALAITLSKRSGTDRTIVGHWQTLYPRLRRLIQFLRDETLPTGAAYDIQSLARRLDGAAASTDNLHLLLQHEARRILKRKRGQRGTEELSNVNLDILLKPIAEGATIADLEQLAQEFVIAHTLSQAEELAAVPNPITVATSL